MNNLEDYIIVAPNVMPTDLCDAILAEYKECSSWATATIEKGTDDSVRNCSIINISYHNIIAQNSEVRAELDKRIFVSAGSALNAYKQKVPLCNVNEDTGYDLLRYNIGQFYKEHTDAFTGMPRSVSCSFSLNDGYEGGEFAFFGGKLKYEIPKGSALLFPSNFMYPHEVLPIISGTRYSIVTWFR